MKVAAVLGGQYGDEGKGKVVDLLADRFQVVARYHGGHNAGHTVKFGDRHFALHLLPAGVVRGTTSVIGPGVVVDPDALLLEIASVEEAGVRVAGNLLLSDRATVILPWHRLLDAGREKAAGAGKLGTTLRGIGPAYEALASRKAVRVADLSRPEILARRIDGAFAETGKVLTSLGVADVPAPDRVLAALLASGEKLRSYVADTGRYLRDHLRKGGTLLAEGAHGAMLDLSAGTFPYVTSSCCTSAGVAGGLHIPPRALDASLVVLKAYSTRVGEGPFPVELFDETGEFLRARGNEYGAVTGRARRCGWVDAVALRYAARINGLDTIALTKLDVLDGCETVRVCVGYRYAGEVLTDFPEEERIWHEAEPVYEELSGWQTSTHGMRDYAELPSKAREYVERLAELVGVGFSLVSTGAVRDETILVNDSVLTRWYPALRSALPAH